MYRFLIVSAFLSLFLPVTRSIAQDTRPRGQSLSDTITLYPATVVALHPRRGDKETLHLDYPDQMAHDGGAVLNRIAGMSSIRKSGGYGFDPVLRGFKYDQINVVYNGSQSASAACPNRMDPPTSQMAPNMIRSIEVLKGPHALRYGCSFGATINFVPVTPEFQDERSLYGRLSGSYESNGNLYRSEGLLGMSHQWYDLGLFAAWSQGGDYTTGDGQIVPSGFHRSSFGTQLGLRLSKNQILKLSATRNLARDADFAALPMDLREDDTWLINMNHEVQFSDGNLRSWSTTLYGSFVDHLMDNLLKPLDPRMANAETVATTQNYGGRTEGTWYFGKSLLYTGVDFRIEGAEGSRVREFLMGPNQGKVVSDNAWQKGEIIRSGLFAEYHIKAGGIRWIASGRLELNRSDIKDPDPGFVSLYPDYASMHINPGISIGGTRRFRDHFSAGIWLGRASRSASLTERFINFFPVGQDPYEMAGNPQLEPEVNNQADLTLKWRSQRTSLGVDLFAAFLQDFISSEIDSLLNPRIPGSPGVRRFSNFEEAFKTGFELSWSQKLFAGIQHQLSLAYTFGQDLIRGEPLPEIAPLDFRYRLSGDYLDRKLRPFISFRHVMEQKRISEEFGETVTGAFSLIDMGIRFRLSSAIEISAGVRNLLDTTYYEHLNRSVRGTPDPIYAPGRSFNLSFSLDFR